MLREFHHQVRGRGHLLDATPVQDRVMHVARDGVQVMCLADGAGSASRSDIGAQAVVSEGCRLMVERFNGLVGTQDAAGVKIEIVGRLRDRIRQTAELHGCDPADLASTFLCVAVSGDRFLGAHVGDGVIGYLKDGELKVASAPDNDEFANQTTFITSSGAVGSMRLFRGSMSGIDGFVLMSDGTAESVYDRRTGRLASAAKKVIEAVGRAPSRQRKNSQHRKQLKRLMEVTIRQATKDDCSIGVLARKDTN